MAEDAETPPPPSSIAGRYRVERQLGRGGMGVVYGVVDERNGAHLALKRLEQSPDESDPAAIAALFEREYHTLAQLVHPHIVSVYDFGTQDGTYYTMELLEGPTLSRARPAWQALCKHARDICSALSLLHSRRLIHRDIGGRNIQLTGNGTAKLIDFGVMSPMGPTSQIVGTPPYVAPEVVQRQELDGRVDLYALGATLYRGLTGRHAYGARRFHDLSEHWAERPEVPSATNPEVPAALDALVLSLLSLNRDARPSTAGEVMERLAAIAELSPVTDLADLAEQGAYLTTPTLVARGTELRRLEAILSGARNGRGGAVLLEGAAGIGRSRMLDACALDAQLQGCLVVRVDAPAQRRPFAAATALVAELLEHAQELSLAAATIHREPLQRMLPELQQRLQSGRPSALPPQAGAERPTRADVLVQLRQFLDAVCAEHALCIAADDVHLLDAETVALLVALAQASPKRSLVVLCTAPSDVQAGGELSLLRAAARRWTLSRLQADEVRALLASVFGEPPGLDRLADQVHRVTAGNPGNVMAVAEHLLGRGQVRYDRGLWHIRPVIDDSELPASMTDALSARAEAVGTVALELARMLALSPGRSFSVAQCAQLLHDRPGGELHAALSELVTANVLAAEGERFRFQHGGWPTALTEQLGETDRGRLHARLADMFDTEDGADAEAISHRLLAGDARGLDALLELLPSRKRTTRFMRALSADAMPTLGRALQLVERDGRPAMQEYRVLEALVRGSMFELYVGLTEYEPRLRAHLTRDSGLDHHATLADEPAETRLRTAMKRAAADHRARDAAQQVLDPQQALGALAIHAMFLLPACTVMCDARMLRSVAALVEPFVELFAPLRAIVDCAQANTDFIVGRPPQARVAFRETLRQLEAFNHGDLDDSRDALRAGIGMTEASLGLGDCLRWADLLETSAPYEANAWDVRRTYYVSIGDFNAAARCQQQGESKLLERGSRQAFAGGQNILSPLGAQIAAGDLTAVKLAIPYLRLGARLHPGVIPFHDLARGAYELLRGDARGAITHLEAALKGAEPGDHGAWAFAAAARIGALRELGALDRAVEFGRGAVAQAELQALWYPDLRRELALAEAQVGDHARAMERLRAADDALEQVGVEGLQRGLVQETMARVALAAEDREAFDHHARATAAIYGRGSGAVLAARCEALSDAARTQRATTGVEPADEVLSQLATQLQERSPRTEVATSELVTEATDSVATRHSGRTSGEER